MADRKELIESMKLLKNYCKDTTECKDCVIEQECLDSYKSSESIPSEWELNESEAELEITIPMIEYEELKEKAKRCDMIDYWNSSTGKWVVFKKCSGTELTEEIPEKIAMDIYEKYKESETE